MSVMSGDSGESGDFGKSAASGESGYSGKSGDYGETGKSYSCEITACDISQRGSGGTGVSLGLVNYWRNALNRKRLFGVPKSRSIRYKTSYVCITYMD